jgi:5-(hydroxymethyl)furfural/furfural oxidase
LIGSRRWCGVGKIGVVTARNKLITGFVARPLDGPAALRKIMIEKVVVEGHTFEQVMRDDDALEDFIRKAVIGV